jgi:hypothetical protein
LTLTQLPTLYIIEMLLHLLLTQFLVFGLIPHEGYSRLRQEGVVLEDEGGDKTRPILGLHRTAGLVPENNQDP